MKVFAQNQFAFKKLLASQIINFDFESQSSLIVSFNFFLFFLALGLKSIQLQTEFRLNEFRPFFEPHCINISSDVLFVAALANQNYTTIFNHDAVINTLNHSNCA